MRVRADILLLIVLVGVIVAISAALANRGFAQPGPLPQALATVTPQPTPTGGWWDQTRLTPPALPKLPGVPAVGTLGGGGAAGGAPAAGQPVPFQVMACPQAQVKITAIVTGQPGWWDVKGVAAIPNLEYWKVELSSDGQGWTALYQSPNPVAGGVLMNFNTRTVPRGAYQLRLLAVDKTGNYGAPCVVAVTTN